MLSLQAELYARAWVLLWRYVLVVYIGWYSACEYSFGHGFCIPLGCEFKFVFNCNNWGHLA